VKFKQNLVLVQAGFLTLSEAKTNHQKIFYLSRIANSSSTP